MTKINEILGEWHSGDIHTLKWFAARGVQQRTAYKYSETNALKRIGPGVFARPLDKPLWVGAIRAMQEELELEVHVGSRTALELQGSGHDLQTTDKPRVELILGPNTSIPTWIKNNEWNVCFQVRRSNLISQNQDLFKVTEQGISVKISSREQAILEFLDTLDLSVSFETGENYLSGLFNLRPTAMQSLLERCTSIKVKRIFLFLAENMELPVFKKLDLKRIDLGKGKRVLIKGGHFNQKYQITVPHNQRDEKNVF